VAAPHVVGAKEGLMVVFMKPKILSWNVRGLNEGAKRLKVRNLLRQWKADIICLQETKLDFVSNSLVRSLWGCHFVDWCYLASCGASGGILIMWDRRIVEKIEVYVGEFVVACSFRSVADNFSWAFARVYVLTLTLLEVPSRTSWLAFLLGGSYLGASGVISMSLAFLLKDLETFVLMRL
jgi:hypothetical protein